MYSINFSYSQLIITLSYNELITLCGCIICKIDIAIQRETIRVMKALVDKNAIGAYHNFMDLNIGLPL